MFPEAKWISCKASAVYFEANYQHLELIGAIHLQLLLFSAYRELSGINTTLQITHITFVVRLYTVY